MMSMGLSDIAILNIKNADYCCIKKYKSNTMKLLQNIAKIIVKKQKIHQHKRAISIKKYRH